MNREICRALLHGDHLSLPPFRFDDALLSRHTTNKSGELAEAAPGVREILFLAQPGRASPHLVRGFEPGTNHRALSTRSRVGFLWKAGMTRGNNLKVAAGVLLEIAQVPRTGSRWPIWPWKLLCRLNLATGACRCLYVIKWMPSRNLASRTRSIASWKGLSFLYQYGEEVSLPGVSEGYWLVQSFKVLFEGLKICFSSTGGALDHQLFWAAELIRCHCPDAFSRTFCAYRELSFEWYPESLVIQFWLQLTRSSKRSNPRIRLMVRDDYSLQGVIDRFWQITCSVCIH